MTKKLTAKSAAKLHLDDAIAKLEEAREYLSQTIEDCEDYLNDWETYEPPTSRVADYACRLYLEALEDCRRAKRRYESGEIAINQYAMETDAAYAQMNVLAGLLGYMGRKIPE